MSNCSRLATISGAWVVVPVMFPAGRARLGTTPVPTGSIAVGKDADLVIIAGDPATRIGDLRNVQIVFKQGIGYDPAKLVESVRGKVGLF